MKTYRIVLALAATAGLAAGAARGQAPPVDPFYTNLLQSGAIALERGEAARAAEELRLACFGMLENPPERAVCLVRLSLAQAKLGEREEFLESFRKLEEVEQRFTVYAAAPLGAGERRTFEEQAAAWVDPEILASIPALAEVASARELAALAAMPAAKRIAALEPKIAADPKNARYRVLLAAAELDRDKAAAALTALEPLAPAAEAGNVGCLRGRALAELGRCAPAADLLAACPYRNVRAELFDPYLGCLVSLERWIEARSLLAAAEPAVTSRPVVAKLAKKIPSPEAAKPAPQLAATPAPSKPAATQAASATTGERAAKRGRSAAKPAATPKPESTGKAAKPANAASSKAGAGQSAKPPAEAEAKLAPAPTRTPAPAPLTAAQRRQAADARASLAGARSLEDLDAALAVAAPLAAARPDLPELQNLVGEIHYRASRWQECAEAYRRGGEAGPADPTQRFYMAVCLYEAGDRGAAATVASTGLEELRRTPFVESYLDRFAAERR